MRLTILKTLLLCLPIIFLCECSNDQAFYTPILRDSTAITLKNQYLQELNESIKTKAGPNIIIILADDLGKNDLSLYDSLGISTPWINQLASEGILFTEAYATSSVCNPSRAGLITGRYQQRFGNERQIMGRYARNGLEYFAFKRFVNTSPLHLTEVWYSPAEAEIRKQGLPESEITLFELLHAIGYRTGCMGKWHLGYNEPFLPINKSVDDFYGFYEAFSLYAPTKDKDIVNYRHKIFQNKMIWRQKRKGASAIVRNGTVIEEDEYLTSRIAQEACRFIEENKKDPFILYVPFNAPHTPFQAPRSYCEKFVSIKDKNREVYYAMILALDDAVGKIMEQVKESGIEESTLIYFSSDNGGATYTGATDNGDLKGGKMTQFEGGLNVPLIMKWKGTLTPGGKYQKPVSLMDIYTTSLSTCNISPPPFKPLDGVDLMPFLTEENPKSPHEYLFWRTDFSKSVRYGKWKLIINSRDNFLMLYDLEADKQERYDLKDVHSGIIDEILSGLSDWESGLIDPLWPGIMEYEEEIDGVKMRFAF